MFRKAWIMVVESHTDRSSWFKTFFISDLDFNTMKIG